jgi:C-methyltransferase C-terminal domain
MVGTVTQCRACGGRLAMLRGRPDYVFILPWNLQDEIRRQLQGIAAWGGKFVTPVPSVRVDS